MCPPWGIPRMQHRIFSWVPVATNRVSNFFLDAGKANAELDSATKCHHSVHGSTISTASERACLSSALIIDCISPPRIIAGSSWDVWPHTEGKREHGNVEQDDERELFARI